MSEVTDADRAAAEELQAYVHARWGATSPDEDIEAFAAIIARHMAAERQELEEANECVWGLFEDLRDVLKQREAAARKALKEVKGEASDG